MPDLGITALAGYRRQADAGLRVLEALAEGARRVSEAQLDAACAAHASAEATRKQLEGASDPQALWRIQSEWAAGCLSASLGYWSALSQVMLEAQSDLGRCLGECASPPKERT